MGSNDLASRVSTGVEGLDQILGGGLPHGMSYTVHGGPGTGKTTLGLQFLLEGVGRNERVLFASMLQRPKDLERIFASHGWSLDGIEQLDLPDYIRRNSAEMQTMFKPDEVELKEATDAVIKGIRQFRPQRIVLDSITELALLAISSHQLRRQMLKLQDLLYEIGCTSLFTVNDNTSVDLPSLQTAMHGVIQLGAEQARYGQPGRWLEVTKVRGLAFLGGRHDFRLSTGGIEVYPNIPVENGSKQEPDWSTISGGNRELDSLFGGGLEAGTTCLITGTTGAGKSTLTSIYVQAAAVRGERSLIYCFDERRGTYLRRSQGLGLDIEQHIERGLVDIREVDVGSLMLGQIIAQTRDAVEQGVKLVVIDSLTGFHQAMPGRELIVHLHELLRYLGGAGVLTLLTLPTHGLSAASQSYLDASYIADTVVLMRHFEAAGRMLRCISVLKKRHGDHERSIREIQSGPGGIRVGPPLTDFQNVLSGEPQFMGGQGELMSNSKDARGGEDNG